MGNESDPHLKPHDPPTGEDLEEGESLQKERESDVRDPKDSPRVAVEHTTNETIEDILARAEQKGIKNIKDVREKRETGE